MNLQLFCNIRCNVITFSAYLLMTHVAEQKQYGEQALLQQQIQKKIKKAPLLLDVKPDLGWQRYVFTLLHQSMFTSVACEAALYVYRKRTSFCTTFPTSVPVRRSACIKHVNTSHPASVSKKLGKLDNTGKLVLLPESELYM